jgi:hypothetical protein
VSQKDKIDVKIIPKVQCSGCKRFFVGLHAFDTHRVGSFQARTRRCLRDGEMYDRGYAREDSLVKCRVVMNNHEVWDRQLHTVWFLIASRERATQLFRKQQA